MAETRSPAELFAIIAEALPAVVSYIDADERYVYANRFYIERYGRPEGLIGRHVRDVLGVEQYARLAPYVRRALAGETVSFEVEVARRDGPPLWATATYVPDRAPDGSVRGFSVLSEDITERRKTQRSLADSIATLRATNETLDGVVLRLRALQAVTSELSNARTAKQIGQVMGTAGAAAIGADRCAIWTAGADGDPELDEPVFVDADTDQSALSPELVEAAGKLGRSNAFVALPLKDGPIRHGVLLFGFAHARTLPGADRELLLTLSRQCEQALVRARLYEAEARARLEAERAREEALASNRSKDEFLAMLGHELRNPLAPIATAVELMKKRDGAEAIARERGVIERQVHHLSRLVDDLLDVARITAGRIQLTREPLTLVDVAARALEMTRPLLDERQHQISVRVPRTLRVSGDATRMAQVVANLLTNAAKYTSPHGHIAVTAERDGGQIVLQVQDDGVGIAPDLLPHVFDLFAQGPQGIERPQGGLGLGLAIVRSLVQLHGGSISAESEGPGYGSTFIVRLPALEAAGAREGARDDEPPAQIDGQGRVLIVDDNQDAAMLLAEALEMAGFATEVAHDGAAALKAADRFAPDVALLDLGLPLMDGYEVARRLRATSGASPKLIAVTGYGQASDRRRSREAGFDIHLVKPVDLPELQEAVTRLMGERS
ncbi:MAG TPA: ATP-binding protein [Polyangia bacterium]|nr:ATP-binding protein [Polyangia bacterium]